MQDNTERDRPVNRLDLLFLIGAYNRREISLEEFIRLSREWAEAIIGQSQKPAAPD